jgi:segregation and condensation protein B
MNNNQKLEGLLYYFGEPVDKEKIKKMLDFDTATFHHAVAELKEQLQNRGTSLVETETTLGLFTAPEMSVIIEAIKKEERSKELTKSSLETLSLIAYSDGVSRSDVDYIRGVNSSFIIKTLTLRGFIEKLPHPTDSRKYIYTATAELYAFLGVRNKHELPDWETFHQEITNKQKSIIEAEQ